MLSVSHGVLSHACCAQSRQLVALKESFLQINQCLGLCDKSGLHQPFLMYSAYGYALVTHADSSSNSVDARLVQLMTITIPDHWILSLKSVMMLLCLLIGWGLSSEWLLHRPLRRLLMTLRWAGGHPTWGL